MFLYVQGYYKYDLSFVKEFNLYRYGVIKEFPVCRGIITYYNYLAY